MIVDVKFSLYGRGAPIPADHAYALYSALSHITPNLHGGLKVGVHPITGKQTGDRRMILNKDSSLTVRIDSDQISKILPLSGKTIGIGDSFLQIGVPSVFLLTPASTLRSRLVNIKGFMESESFQQAVRRQLDDLEVSQDVQIDISKRRTFSVHDKNVVGFEVVLRELASDDSLRVQEEGIGGRRKMGCGIFVPFHDNSQTKRSQDHGQID